MAGLLLLTKRSRNRVRLEIMMVVVVTAGVIVTMEAGVVAEVAVEEAGVEIASSVGSPGISLESAPAKGQEEAETIGTAEEEAETIGMAEEEAETIGMVEAVEVAVMVLIEMETGQVGAAGILAVQDLTDTIVTGQDHTSVGVAEDFALELQSSGAGLLKKSLLKLFLKCKNLWLRFLLKCLSVFLNCWLWSLVLELPLLLLDFL